MNFLVKLIYLLFTLTLSLTPSGLVAQDGSEGMIETDSVSFHYNNNVDDPLVWLRNGPTLHLYQQNGKETTTEWYGFTKMIQMNVYYHSWDGFIWYIIRDDDNEFYPTGIWDPYNRKWITANLVNGSASRQWIRSKYYQIRDRD